MVGQAVDRDGDRPLGPTVDGDVAGLHDLDALLNGSAIDGARAGGGALTGEHVLRQARGLKAARLARAPIVLLIAEPKARPVGDPLGGRGPPGLYGRKPETSVLNK